MARERAGDALCFGVLTVRDVPAGVDARLAGVAAWSMVHRLAALWLHGFLPVELGEDPIKMTQTVARLLFRPAG